MYLYYLHNLHYPNLAGERRLLPVPSVPAAAPRREAITSAAAPAVARAAVTSGV